MVNDLVKSEAIKTAIQISGYLLYVNKYDDKMTVMIHKSEFRSDIFNENNEKYSLDENFR